MVIQDCLARRSHEANKRRFIAVMDDIEHELGAAGGPFFLGKDVSLVDCVFAPMLERIAASIPYYKGFVVRGEGCARQWEQSWPQYTTINALLAVPHTMQLSHRDILQGVQSVLQAREHAGQGTA